MTFDDRYSRRLSEVIVVSGSATAGLAGPQGAGSYAATGMEDTLELDYEIG